MSGPEFKPGKVDRSPTPSHDARPADCYPTTTSTTTNVNADVARPAKYGNQPSPSAAPRPGTEQVISKDGSDGQK